MYFYEAKEAVLGYKQAQCFYPKQFSLKSPITMSQRQRFTTFREIQFYNVTMLNFCGVSLQTSSGSNLTRFCKLHLQLGVVSFHSKLTLPEATHFCLVDCDFLHSQFPFQLFKYQSSSSTSLLNQIRASDEFFF